MADISDVIRADGVHILCWQARLAGRHDSLAGTTRPAARQCRTGQPRRAGPRPGPGRHLGHRDHADRVARARRGGGPRPGHLRRPPPGQVPGRAGQGRSPGHPRDHRRNRPAAFRFAAVVGAGRLRLARPATPRLADPAFGALACTCQPCTDQLDRLYSGGYRAGDFPPWSSSALTRAPRWPA